MKINAFLVLMICVVFPSQLFSQTNFINQKPSDNNDKRKYDSLNNFLGVQSELYVGQVLTVIRRPDLLQKSGFKNFVKDFKKDIYDKKNIYTKSGKAKDYFTPYADLDGRSFLVLGEIKNNGTFLKLRDIEANEILYYKYDYRFKHSFPFFVDGFVKKQSILNLGKRYYARAPKLNHYCFEKQLTTDINNREFKAKLGSLWEIKDIGVSEINGNFNIVFVMRNEKDSITINVFQNLIKEYEMIEESKVNFIKKAYSDQIFDKVLNHEFTIGMDKVLVRLAAGNPNSINTTSLSSGTREQWVYEYKYLYFEDGKLVSIQYTN